MTAGRPVLELGALDLTIALSPHPDSAPCCASSLRRRPDIEPRRNISTGGVTEIGGRLIQREPGGVDADSSRPANLGPDDALAPAPSIDQY